MNWLDEHDDAVRTHLRRVLLQEVDDSKSQQRLTFQGLKGETFKNVVRSQHFGLSSVPPAGSEGLILEQGSRSDRAHALGFEHPDYRPTGYVPGDTVLYDAHNNAISLVKNNIRIVGAQTITMEATKIILKGEVHLGDDDGGVPAAMKGTVDTAGNADVENLATKVYLV